MEYSYNDAVWPVEMSSLSLEDSDVCLDQIGSIGRSRVSYDVVGTDASNVQSKTKQHTHKRRRKRVSTTSFDSENMSNFQCT